MGHKHTRPTHYQYKHVMSRRRRKSHDEVPNTDKNNSAILAIVSIIVILGLLMYIYVRAK